MFKGHFGAILGSVQRTTDFISKDKKAAFDRFSPYSSVLHFNGVWYKKVRVLRPLSFECIENLDIDKGQEHN